MLWRFGGACDKSLIRVWRCAGAGGLAGEGLGIRGVALGFGGRLSYVGSCGTVQ